MTAPFSQGCCENVTSSYILCVYKHAKYTVCAVDMSGIIIYLHLLPGISLASLMPMDQVLFIGEGLLSELLVVLRWY